MAYMITIQCVVDEADESHVYDSINELLRGAEAIADWRFEDLRPAGKKIDDALYFGSYAEGDAFLDHGVPAFKPFTLVVGARANDEFGEAPAWAEVTVSPEFLQTLMRLRRICQENDLESVTVPKCPDRWDREGDLLIRGDSLCVWQDDFWFEAHPKYASYGVETVAVGIADLATVATLNTEGAGFRRVGEKVFHSESDLDEFIQVYQEDNGCTARCSDCGEQTEEVIGCPDGAEVCKRCFDAGGH